MHIDASANAVVVTANRGMKFLRPNSGTATRRVLYLNSYGMGNALQDVAAGVYPSEHLWGCWELAQMGYEVAMPNEPQRSGRFFNYRRQDLRHVIFARRWLGSHGILYA